MSTTLVLGGAGALGRSVVRAFKSRGGAVISMDVVDSPHTSHNILLPGRIEQSSVAPAIAELEKLLSSTGSSPLTSIMCVAGGWAGGDAGADDVVDSADQMLMSSVMPSVLSAHIGARFLPTDGSGLLVLTGAEAAKGSTPGMLGYGLAKAAVHQLAAGLADGDGGLPSGTSVNAILPTTLDTPGNRAGMPDADFSSWTSCDNLADRLVQWSEDRASRPDQGELVSV